MRKISKEIKNAKSVDSVKKADKKVTKKISKEKSAITIDQALSTLSTFIINSPDIKKVEAVKELLKDLINFKNKKQMAMEKLVASKKVTAVTK